MQLGRAVSWARRTLDAMRLRARAAAAGGDGGGGGGSGGGGGGGGGGRGGIEKEGGGEDGSEGGETRRHLQQTRRALRDALRCFDESGASWWAEVSSAPAAVCPAGMAKGRCRALTYEMAAELGLNQSAYSKALLLRPLALLDPAPTEGRWATYHVAADSRAPRRADMTDYRPDPRLRENMEVVHDAGGPPLKSAPPGQSPLLSAPASRSSGAAGRGRGRGAGGGRGGVGASRGTAAAAQQGQGRGRVPIV